PGGAPPGPGGPSGRAQPSRARMGSQSGGRSATRRLRGPTRRAFVARCRAWKESLRPWRAAACTPPAGALLLRQRGEPVKESTEEYFTGRNTLQGGILHREIKRSREDVPNLISL